MILFRRIPHLLRASWQQNVDQLYVIRIEKVPLCFVEKREEAQG